MRAAPENNTQRSAQAVESPQNAAASSKHDTMGTKIIQLHPSTTARSIIVLRSVDRFRDIVVSALDALPHARIASFHTPKSAITAIRTRSPDLALVDLDLRPTEVLEGLETLPPNAPPLLCVSRNIERYEDALQSIPGAVPIDKPHSARILRCVVEGLLDRPELPDSPFLASDYIQLSCSGRHSISIDIEGPSTSGSILVLKGEVWAATTPMSEGIEALSELAFESDARVVCCSAGNVTAPRNIPDLPWEHLLLDAARRHDERARRGDSEPSGLLEVDFGGSVEARNEPPTPDGGASQKLAQFIERAADALLQKNYPEAMAAYEEASDIAPDNPIVRSNLIRLREITSHNRTSTEKPSNVES